MVHRGLRHFSVSYLANNATKYMGAYSFLHLQPYLQTRHHRKKGGSAVEEEKGRWVLAQRKEV